MTNILQKVDESIMQINDTFEKVEDGEISAIVEYRYLKKWESVIKNALKLTEIRARNMVEESPLEHKDFRISVRKTYDFKSSEYYQNKLKELHIEENKEKLKEVEKLIKSATDMDKDLFDENWEMIDKVEIKYNQILSYTPKNKE